VIELRNISDSRGGTKLFSDFNWLLPDPGIYLLLGPNGSGKTLLTSILTGRLRPGSGQVLIDGESVYSLVGRYSDPIFSADATLQCQETEPLDLYLEAECSACGGSVSLIRDIWGQLEEYLGASRRTPVNQLSHGQVLLSQIALAGVLPVRLAVLDGHLTYLDEKHISAAERLLNQAAQDDKFVVLSASRLADYFPRARERFLLSPRMPVQVVSLDPAETLDTSMEIVHGEVVLRIKTWESPYAAGGLASGKHFTIVSQLEDGFRIRPHNGIDAVVEEFKQLGLTVRALEWESK